MTASQPPAPPGSNGHRRSSTGVSVTFFLVLGLLFMLLFVIGAIGDINAVDRAHGGGDAALDVYVAAIAQSAGYAIAMAVCWGTAAIVARLD